MWVVRPQEYLNYWWAEEPFLCGEMKTLVNLCLNCYTAISWVVAIT